MSLFPARLSAPDPDIDLYELESMSYEDLAERTGWSYNKIRKLRVKNGIDLKAGAPFFVHTVRIIDKVDRYNEKARKEAWDKMWAEGSAWENGMPLEPVKPDLREYIRAWNG